MNRRNFLQTSILATIPAIQLQAKPIVSSANIRPQRLNIGDTVGLVCPAGPAFQYEAVQIGADSLRVLGLNVKFGNHIFDRHGYLAGKDIDRAADLMDMFRDPQIKAIMAIHGGWGSARLLEYIDYNVIRENPKIFIGYSDITAMLLAIHAKTGLITFHGPVASSTWNNFTVNYFKSLLMNAENDIVFRNPVDKGDNLVIVNDRIQTITEGITIAELVGGNLTVLTAILGSPYLPDWEGKILFIEDVNEDIYRVDRMLTQLKLAGILNQISGFVFGKCTDCNPSKNGFGSLTLEDLMNEHIKPLGIPAYMGAMIGHITDKFTLPIGGYVEMNSIEGTIKLLESAVV